MLGSLLVFVTKYVLFLWITGVDPWNLQLNLNDHLECKEIFKYLTIKLNNYETQISNYIIDLIIAFLAIQYIECPILYMYNELTL